MLLFAFTVLLLLNVFTQQASGEACVDLASSEECKALWDKDRCLSDIKYAKENCRETCFLCEGMDPSLLEQ
ncbi:hypothetical protein OESDEN_06704 [Oesophagostomum dentatum]|uniref:ShKT domain-containing protein n=1 Tax=Oesophagostomum dentatum TaxID=61180 RepID=A0A0B1TDE8_OESDE|nr:hypothetical protein OESDEN_06704 [Oesophagostomum dentatum]